MPILQGEVTAIRAHGNPIDQFSFKEGEDGQLNVLLTDAGGGDAMGNPEHAGQGKQARMALLRVALASFSDAPVAASEKSYTILPRPEKGYSLQNRFVGDWVLWGAGAGWHGAPGSGSHVYITNVKQPAAHGKLPLDHGVDRIEAMGSNAVVVGSGKSDLFFSAIELKTKPELKGSHVRPNAAQGETRSHGFFFLPEGSDGGGLLGLPVRTQGRPGMHLVHGSAEVTFLRVSPELKFSALGSLAARVGNVRDDCVVSCVDWYGNARPIFFRGRIFALLGYELVEGVLEEGKELREKARIEYLAPRVTNE
jgi:hypothetical protein